MANLAELLNWRGNAPFATLHGAFPLLPTETFEYDTRSRIHDFSSLDPPLKVREGKCSGFLALC